MHLHHPTVPHSKAYPGPTPPRGLGRVVERMGTRRRGVLSAIVGWCLLIAALALTVWARFAPVDESKGVDPSRLALAAVVLAMMAAGTALSGGTRCKP